MWVTTSSETCRAQCIVQFAIECSKVDSSLAASCWNIGGGDSSFNTADCRSHLLWKPQQKDDAYEVNYNHKRCPLMTSKRMSMSALTKWSEFLAQSSVQLTWLWQFNSKRYLEGNCCGWVDCKECNCCVEWSAISLWNACFQHEKTFLVTSQEEFPPSIVEYINITSHARILGRETLPYAAKAYKYLYVSGSWLCWGDFCINKYDFMCCSTRYQVLAKNYTLYKYLYLEGPAQHVPAVTTETVEWCAPAVLRLAWYETFPIGLIRNI